MTKCKLCGEELKEGGVAWSELGPWIFHYKCYLIAVERLSSFMEILTLPQDEFDEWLADDSI